MKVVFVSDTHLNPPEIPDGDLLIHAGDLTMSGTVRELAQANRWLCSLPHRNKVVIAGNHDFIFERDNALARSMLDSSIGYLQDSEALVAGLYIYGSPWTPRFFDWAFNQDRGPKSAERWSRIPRDLDILVTHGPPKGILDMVGGDGSNQGCKDLLDAVREKRPKIHAFGHIHEAWGQKAETDGTTFVNAATGYYAENKPICITLGTPVASP